MSISDDYTTNHTLRKHAKKLGVPLNFVWHKDKLKTPSKDGLYILNLADEGKEGTHWVGLFKEGNAFAYFDPFGFRAPLEVERYVPTYIFNDEVIQDPRYGGCGSYVLEFGEWMHKRGGAFKKRFQDFLSKFNPDVKKNRSVLRWLERN